MSANQGATLAFGAVGAYFGGPIGYAVGAAIGGMLFPEQLPDITAQSLGEMQLPSASYGNPIPIVYGTVRLSTTLMWTTGRKATKHEETQGGKGGPSQTTEYYTYSLNGAFAICEGPIDGVRRIWINGRLMWDASTAETQMALEDDNGQLAANVIVFKGEEDQEPSSLQESFEGVGSVPAYRGLAYIEFEELQLEQFGNSMVNVEVEVVKIGTVDEGPNVVHLRTNAVNVPLSVILDEGTVLESSISVVNDYSGTLSVIRRDLFGEVINTKQFQIDITRGGYADTNGGAAGCKNDPYFVWWFTAQEQSIGTTGTLMWFNGIYAVDYYIIDQINYPVDQKLGPYELTDGNLWSTAGETIRLNDKYYITICQRSIDDYVMLRYVIDPVFGNPTMVSTLSLRFNESDWKANYSEGVDIWPDMKPGSNYFWLVDTALSPNYSAWTLMDEDFNIIRRWGWQSGTGPYGGARPIGAPILLSSDGWAFRKNSSLTETYTYYEFDPDVDDSLWVGTGFATDSHDNFYQCMPLNNRWFWTKYELITLNDIVAQGDVTVADIVSDQCERVGLDTGTELDVSGLTRTVSGMFINRNMSARNALESLQPIGFFDVAEVDSKIVCTERGGSSIKTIPQDDLGVIEGTEAARIPDMEIMRRAELELPRKVSVSYMNPSDDYQINTQLADRLTALGEGVQNARLPIVLTNKEAMKIADTMLYTHYAEREKVTFFLSTKYIDLAPNDVVTVGDSAHRIRIESITQNLVGSLTVKGVVELTNETYASTQRDEAIVSSTTPTIGMAGPTLWVFMNLPLLQSSQNRTGFYVAAQGVYDGWTGYDLYVSEDNAAFTQVGAGNVSAGMGTVTDTLASTSNTTTWNWEQTINVRTDSVLSSDTEINVMNGANVAAIGQSEGDWEIIQWVTASAESDGTYTLSQLLRGRNGTEYAVGQHNNLSQEDFVLLQEDNSVVFIGTDSAKTDVNRYWKAITRGNVVQATQGQVYVEDGETLRPYSPAKVRSYRNSANSLITTWARRDRLGYGSFSYLLNSSEDTTEYEVDYYADASILLRTVSAVSSETDTYTSAERVADGASANAVITVNVFQISATVGRGHPATGTG
jgi:hypothetical protein